MAPVNEYIPVERSCPTKGTAEIADLDLLAK